MNTQQYPGTFPNVIEISEEFLARIKRVVRTLAAGTFIVALIFSFALAVIYLESDRIKFESMDFSHANAATNVVQSLVTTNDYFPAQFHEQAVKAEIKEFPPQF